MKHFVLEGEYLVPFEEIAPLIPQHRAFLQKGYEAGHFLCSGPQIPARGGFLLARAASRETLDEILAEEPFTKARKMRFVRITEFNPVQHQPMLKDWFAKP
ncbi:MAG TPA: YciI family protein [Reyranella sp.]|nr:YciI family protein [Reyranella sp.]